MLALTLIHKSLQTAPIGEDITDNIQDPFERTWLFVMARDDDTAVTLTRKNGTVEEIVVSQGVSDYFSGIHVGDIITSTSPIQVDIIVGDENANYEIRWYALVPTTDWSNEYWSPVGASETVEKARVWVFNPGNEIITVSAQYKSSTDFLRVDPGKSVRFDTDIPTNSGVRVFTGNETDPDGQNFFALLQMDIEITSKNGQAWDWGHPLIPADDLTSQALVGLGVGCPELLLQKTTDCSGATNVSEGKGGLIRECFRFGTASHIPLLLASSSV